MWRDQNDTEVGTNVRDVSSQFEIGQLNPRRGYLFMDK